MNLGTLRASMVTAVAFFIGGVAACSTATPRAGVFDSAPEDSAAEVDAPPGTPDAPDHIDAPPGTPDAPDHIDAPPGAPDAAVDATVDATPDASSPDANTCPTTPCDITQQCGCAANQTCDVDSSDLMGTNCRAVNVPGRETSTCASFSQCDHGYVCLGATGSASCVKYCSSNADCGSPRGQCVVDITDGTNPLPGIPSVCSSNCDPTNAAAGGCPASWKCGMYTATHASVDHDVAECAPAGAGAQGASCKVGTGTAAHGDDSLCAANFSCTAISATTFTCLRVCNRDTGGPQCAALGLTCFGFNPALKIGGTEYGVCN